MPAFHSDLSALESHLGFSSHIAISEEGEYEFLVALLMLVVWKVGRAIAVVV